MDSRQLDNIRERHLKVAGVIAKRMPDDADYLQVLFNDVGALLRHVDYMTPPELPRAA